MRKVRQWWRMSCSWQDNNALSVLGWLRRIVGLCLLTLVTGMLAPSIGFAGPSRHEQNFWNQIERKRCWKAYQQYNSYLARKVVNDKKKVMLKAILSCWRAQKRNNYVSANEYQVSLNYLKLDSTSRFAWNAHLAVATYTDRRLNVYYYYPNNTYQKQLVKSLGDVRRLASQFRNSLSLKEQSQWQFLEVRQGLRQKKYSLAFEFIQTLSLPKFPADVRHQAYTYWMNQILPRFRPGGAPKGQQARRIWLYRKAAKAMRGTKYSRQWEYYLLQNEHQQHINKKRWPSPKFLRRLKQFSSSTNSWSRSALTLYKQWVKPGLTLSAQTLLRANQPKNHISLSVLRVRTLKVRLFRANLRGAFLHNKKLFDPAKVRRGKVVWRKKVSLRRIPFNYWVSTTAIQRHVRLPRLRPGSYVLDVRGTNRFGKTVKTSTPLLVSSYSIALKTFGKKAVLMVADGKNSRPIPNAKVWIGVGRAYRVGKPVYYRNAVPYRRPYRYRRRRGYPQRYRRYRLPYYRRSYGYRYNYNYQVSQKKSGTTDANGIVSFTLSKKAYPRGLFVLACVKNACTTYRGYRTYRQIGMHENVFWTSDRGAYRPGQTYRFKGVLVVRRSLTKETHKNRKIQVIVRGPRGKVIYKKFFTSSAYGSFDGSFVIPKTVKLGLYSAVIQVYYGKKQRYIRNYARRFRVEEYRRPKVKVVANLMPGRFLAGETLKWKVQARYTFGGAVRAGKVRWRLGKFSVYPRFSMFQPYAWLLGLQTPNNGLRTFEQWEQQQKYLRRNLRNRVKSYKRSILYYNRRCKRYRSRRRRRRRYYRYRRYNPCIYIKTYERGLARVKKQLAQVTWKTGVLNERGELVVKTPTSSRYSFMQYFLQVEVTDPSGQTSQGHGSTVIGRKEAFSFVRLERQIVRPGGKVVVHLQTLRPDGKPISLPGKIEVRRIRWRRNGQITWGRLLRRIKVKTKANGKAVAQFSMDALGYFRVTYKVKGKNGVYIAKRAHFWLAGPRLKRLSSRTPSIQVVVDRKVYKPGDKITVLIRQKKRPHSYWVTVENKGLRWSRLVRAKGRITFLQIPVTEGMAPNAWVSVSHFQDYSWIHRFVRIAVPPTHRFLRVKLGNFKSSYRPGEKVKWNLSVVNGNKKPVQTEFLLLAYDRSLDAIGGLKWPSLKRTFVPRIPRNIVQSVGGRWVLHEYLHKGTRFYNQINYRQLLAQIRRNKRARERAKRLARLARKNRKRRYRPRTRSRRLLGSRRARSRGGYGRGGMASAPKAPTKSMDLAPSAPKPEPARRMAPRPPQDSADDDASKPQKQKVARSGNVTSNLAGGSAGKSMPEPRIRSDFRETAVWLAKVKTDATGKATVLFRWPDSLTTWSVRAVAVGTDSEVGSLQTITQTKQPLMIRLATPRFVMQGDEAEISAMVYNRGAARDVTVSLNVAGAAVLTFKPRRGRLGAGENRRYNFKVKPTVPGVLRFSAKVQASGAADAVSIKLPVHAFGMPQRLHWAGALRKGETRTIPVMISKDVVKDTQKMEMVLTASLSHGVFESLGYLVKFPYGCVEQTMSRFLPAVLVAKTFANFDKAKPKLARRLPRVLKAGLARLYNFQHRDGGWGWWKHDRTNHFMTAYVLFGLAGAKQAGIQVRSGVIRRAARYLLGQMRRLRRQPALHAYALYALALSRNHSLKEADHSLRYLKRLNAYGHALLALAFEAHGDKRSAIYVLKKLLKKVKDAGGGRFHLKGQGTLRGWSQDGLEATAVALRAFVKNKFAFRKWLGMARWLLDQRRGNRWRSTRDSAQALLSLGAFVQAMGKQKGLKQGVEVSLDGRVILRRFFSTKDPKRAGSRLVLSSKDLPLGSKQLKVRNIGNAPLYFGAVLRFVSLATRIRQGGNPKLQVSRSYFRVIQEKGKEVLKPIQWGETVPAGAIVEVQVKLKAQQMLRYLLIEDKKPAGLEPVQIRSGRPTQSWISHFELRDTHAAFFVGYLGKGYPRTLKYRLRAERAGKYHTLPAHCEAMYSPKMRSHSASFLFVVR